MILTGASGHHEEKRAPCSCHIHDKTCRPFHFHYLKAAYSASQKALASYSVCLMPEDIIDCTSSLRKPSLVFSEWLSCLVLRQSKLLESKHAK